MAGLGLALLLLVGGLVILLATAADRAVVVRRAIELANGQIAGRIELGTAWLFPNGHFVAHDVAIRGPDGEVIARAATVDTYLDLRALAGRRVHLTQTRVGGGTVHLATDDHGQVNLAAAFALRHPSPGTGEPGPRVEIEVAELQVDEAWLRLGAAAPSGVATTVFDLWRASVHGAVLVDERQAVHVDARELTAEALAPLKGPFQAAGTVDLDGSRLRVTTSAALDDLRLSGHGELDIATLGGQATVVEGSVGPRLLSVWLGDLDPQGLKGTAELTLRNRVVRVESAKAYPRSGPGGLRGSGQLDLGTGAAEAELVGEHVDARTLLGRLPSSDLSFEIHATGGDMLQDTRSLQAQVAVGASAVRGQEVGPAGAVVHFAGGTLTLSKVDVTLPGARIQGSGTLSGKRVSAQAKVAAPDLGRLRDAVAQVLDMNLPHFAGRFTGEGGIEGPLPHPALRAEVQAPRLSLNGLVAEEVEAHLLSARLGRPLDLEGHLAIARLWVADHRFDGVGTSLVWKTPNLHVEIQARERDAPLGLVADLEVPRSLESANLSALKLQAAGTDWLLAHPAAIDLRHGLAFQRLELRSEPQRLAVSLEVTLHSLKTEVAVEALELARLPAGLLGRLPLSGRVEGSARYQEEAGQRSGGADLSVLNGSYGGLAIPRASLKGTIADRRLSLQLSAQFTHGDLSLVGQGSIPDGLVPLEAQLIAKGLSLDDFVGLEPRLAGNHGTLSLQLHASGDGAAPRITLSAAAVDVDGPWTRPLQADASQPLSINLDATLSPAGLDDTLRVNKGPEPLMTMEGIVHITWPELVLVLTDSSRSVPAVFASEFDQRVTLASLPLEPWMRLVAGVPAVEGTVSATGHLRGSARAPRGGLHLDAANLVCAGRPLGKLDLDLEAADARIHGEVHLHPPEGQLTASADWLLAPEMLGDARARRAAGLTADLAVTGIPLAADRDGGSGLQGEASGAGTFRGSLADPAARAQVSLQGLRLEATPLGSLEAEATWNGARLVATLAGRQPQGGQLDGHADLPLTPEGAAPTQPLSASLVASGFDLSPFSAFASRGGAVREIAGRLDSRLTVGGTWASPEPGGTIALRGAKLALASVGQFEQVEAQVRLDAEGAHIDRLAGKSDSGTFLATGVIRRVAAAPLAVQVHVGTEHLGIYQADRLLGFLSSDEDLSGRVGGKSADLELAVHRALLTLPQLVPRVTGPTALDPDIVFDTQAPILSRIGPPYAIRLAVNAPGGLEVQATDLDLRARAALVLTIAGDVRATGGVSATGGEVNAYGRRFLIDRANLTFGQGDETGPANNPTIDARASQTISPYRLFIDVTGHVSDPRIVTSSDPALDRERVSQLLISGSADGISGGGSSSSAPGGGLAAASALGGFFTEKLRESLGSKLPLDVLTVEPVHIEAGKHLTPQLYVGVVENMGVTDPRANGAEVHANYRLSDQWSIDSRYGTAQAGNLDLQWSMNW